MKDSGNETKDEYLKTLSEVELRNYKARLTLQSYQLTVLTDVTPFVELITPVPLLFILAEDDFLPGQREAYNVAKEPKSLVTVKGQNLVKE